MEVVDGIEIRFLATQVVALLFEFCGRRRGRGGLHLPHGRRNLNLIELGYLRDCSSREEDRDEEKRRRAEHNSRLLRQMTLLDYDTEKGELFLVIRQCCYRAMLAISP